MQDILDKAETIASNRNDEVVARALKEVKKCNLVQTELSNWWEARDSAHQAYFTELAISGDVDKAISQYQCVLYESRIQGENRG